MRSSKIEWTDVSWNPIRGCSHVSPGCARCYAERMAARFCGPKQPYHGVVANGRWNGVVRIIGEKLAEPYHWKLPRRVFVGSMSDLFHEGIPDETIALLVDIMGQCEQHVFQVLTKRSSRMRALLCRWYEQLPPNIWVGTSVESQEYVTRLDDLLAIPAAVKFVSAEPLLTRLDLTSYLDRLDWVIAGCESGAGRREAPLAWFEDLCDQCLDAGVPYFCKQAVIGEEFAKMPPIHGRVRDAYPAGVTA
jgi:protein gp37